MALSATAAAAPSAALTAFLSLNAPLRNIDIRAPDGSEPHDDLAEHLPALQPFQPLLELRERKLGVDHGPETTCHLGERGANIAHRRAKRAEDPVLLLEKLHQVDGCRRARGRAAHDQPSASFEREQRACKRRRADVLEG